VSDLDSEPYLMISVQVHHPLLTAMMSLCINTAQHSTQALVSTASAHL
jgi:hypothetical protein